MKLFLESLGCARNLVDSEVMLGRLAQAGFDLTREPAEAEIIVVNTCSFIRAAADESIDTILELARFKQSGACRRLIVTGCLPERYREAISAALPEVDVFLGTGAFDRIVEAARGVVPAQGCLLPDPDLIPPASGAEPRVQAAPHWAYLKIAEGCSRHCTYCIIPRLRGRQKSRPLETLRAEARALIAAGARELVLVAQDTTAYGRDLAGAPGLARLLADLAELSEAVWIRFLYGHPESIDDAVIRTVAERPNLCPYFDLPVQHASDRILKRMGRGCGQADLLALFASIRARLPWAALRTTVIVGFPGESDDDFNRLLGFVETVEFDHLGVFTYSDAEDLPSHGLSDPVPSAVARGRRDRLMRLQRDISSRRLQAHRGRVYDVLVEEASGARVYIGRTVFQAPEVDGITYVNASALEIGQVVPVAITDSLDYDLVGDAVCPTSSS
jgi:ribosomal protein S12 methylthiotransferase